MDKLFKQHELLQVFLRWFFIQNGTGPWSGVWVYVSSPTVSSGDEVQVSGNVEEYNGLTEIAAQALLYSHQAMFYQLQSYYQQE